MNLDTFVEELNRKAVELKVNRDTKMKTES